MFCGVGEGVEGGRGGGGGRGGEGRGGGRGGVKGGGVEGGFIAGGPIAGGGREFGGWVHLGFTILSFLGRLIQSWKPHRSPSVTPGISLCTMPRPAVIHCTPPGPITPCSHSIASRRLDRCCCTDALSKAILGCVLRTTLRALSSVDSKNVITDPNAAVPALCITLPC